jgi:alpha-1,3-rhamnosyl/mannosyltransferase
MCESVLSKFELQEKKYILAVGTLEPRKNITRLLEAYRSLDESLRHEFKLVVVGKKSWADDFPFVENVLFTGYVDEVDLPYLYSSAQCFVMPSIYEGFGIPVLEAMAAGRPVIALAAGGALETIREGETGVFFKSPTVESLSEALLRFDGMTFDPARIRRQADTFNRAAFVRGIRDLVGRVPSSPV